MTDLPDINVWLALVDENHIHHTTASQYWHDQLNHQAAFCRITMLGLLRLSTHPQILSRTLTHEEAWGIYRQYLANPAVCFLAEPATTEAQFATLSLAINLPHRLWTDTYLVQQPVGSSPPNPSDPPDPTYIVRGGHPRTM